MENLGTPKLTRVAPEQWKLEERFTYRTLSGWDITVPAGFITDGASTPLGIILTPWNGKYDVAVLIHDYLYDLLFNQHLYHPAAPTRKAADAILLEAMRRGGVAPAVYWSMWFWVRALGANDWVKSWAVS